MEEELQQSVMVSDEDAEYETAGETEGDATIIASGPNGIQEKMDTDPATTDNGDTELSDRDASGEDVDASGEEDNDYMAHRQISSHNSRQATLDDDEDEDEEDNEDDEVAAVEEGEREENDMDVDGDEDVDAEGEEYEDDEGVGAVKFQPGTRDDDDGEDSESDRSESPSANEEESDEEAAWEDAVEAEEDHDDEETAASNNCVFCGQTEDDDPSEEFETYLACTRCGGNVEAPDVWKCPQCFNTESDIEAEDEEMEEDQDIDHDVEQPSQQSDIPDLSGEHQSEQQVDDEGASSQDDDDGELDEEPMEAPRTLRKRKSSSLEDDGNSISLRKRRRNQSNDAASEGTARTGSVEPGRHQPSRTLRLKVTRPPPVAVEKHTRTSLVLRLQVKPGNLKEILSRKKREKRRQRQPGTATRPPPQRPAPPSRATIAAISALPTPFTSDNYSQPFYNFYDRETDEMKGKPYGGVLTEAEADTTKTAPTNDDRDKFVAAKHKAEDEWRARLLDAQDETVVPSRRPKKANDVASKIECIEFGGWEIDTWYAAPYPAEYTRNRVLFICEFCLKYMNSDYVAWRHKLKCPAKHPPGDEIYRHGSVSVFEVDGRKNPVYCQNLCLLAKLFLGSKTLYYDVEPFLFYVLCEYNDTGYHFVGYFSKEKRASSQNNVSCILTLPIHQRKGYGNLLIDFSYLLTKVEEKTGSPEKPLSDMGLVSYRNYWRLILCRYFLNLMEKEKGKTPGLSVKQISADTGMTADDVVSALEGLRALVRDPQTKMYAFRVDLDYCRQYVDKWETKGYVQLKSEALVWTPYVMGRSNAVNFELGPPINTIAPREEDEAKVDEGQGVVGAEDQPMPNAMVNGEKHSESAPDADTEGDAVVEASVDAEAEADADPDTQMNVNEEKPQDPPVENGDAEPTPVQSIEDIAQGQEKDKDAEMEDAEVDGPPAWLRPYQTIPFTRFEVFPAVPAGRRDRTRTSVSRPTAPRTVSSTSRPKRPSSNRRSSSSRPRSSSKKKSGGTGRGPGRWPKGTKKSDYGNAASGPGLPPGWNDKHSKLQAVTEGNDPEQEVAVEEAAEDSVVVSTRVNGTKVNGNANVDDASGAESSGEQAVEDTEDVDAEGEEI
ncbi:hypothetical protein ACHAO9_004265 [Fusarium lateritium]